ncbi:MAG TPA: GMP synthase, partial [Flavobacterium sp.]|nr:GMP synthase [Flavobacterium sp.]
MSNQIRVAVLDMYNGEPNQGMRCIIDIINRFNQMVTFQIFDVRGKNEFPDIKKFDIYISTGGPGNPLEGDGNWDLKWYDFIEQLTIWNKEQKTKKHVLFICHSFQMACHHFGLATLNKRKSTSFGVMTIHKTEEGTTDPVLEGLQNPFYAIDSRDY